MLEVTPGGSGQPGDRLTQTARGVWRCDRGRGTRGRATAAPRSSARPSVALLAGHLRLGQRPGGRARTALAFFATARPRPPPSSPASRPASAPSSSASPAGVAVAELKNTIGQAQAQALDLGLIGIDPHGRAAAATAVSPQDQLPQPTAGRQPRGRHERQRGRGPRSPARRSAAGASTSRPPPGRRAEAVVRRSPAILGPLLTVRRRAGRGRRPRSSTGEARDGPRAGRRGPRHRRRRQALRPALGRHPPHGQGPDAEADASTSAPPRCSACPIPLESLAALETTLNTALESSGVTITFPKVERFTEPADLVRVTPLRIVLKDSPVGKAALGPVLNATREQREQLFDQIAGRRLRAPPASCSSATSACRSRRAPGSSPSRSAAPRPPPASSCSRTRSATRTGAARRHDASRRRPCVARPARSRRPAGAADGRHGTGGVGRPARGALRVGPPARVTPTAPKGAMLRRSASSAWRHRRASARSTGGTSAGGAARAGGARRGRGDAAGAARASLRSVRPAARGGAGVRHHGGDGVGRRPASTSSYAGSGRGAQRRRRRHRPGGTASGTDRRRPAGTGGGTGGGGAAAAGAAAAGGVSACTDRTAAGARRPLLAALLRVQRRQRRRHLPGRHRRRDHRHRPRSSRARRRRRSSPTSPAQSVNDSPEAVRGHGRSPWPSTSPSASSSTAASIKHRVLQTARASAPPSCSAAARRRRWPTPCGPPRSIGAFADISGITIPYADALARQRRRQHRLALPVAQVVRRAAGPTRGASSPTAPTSSSRRRRR